MEILGQIIGIAIVIFFFVAFIGGLVFLWEAQNYDDGPDFKTEIKIRFKPEDEDNNDENEDKQ